MFRKEILEKREVYEILEELKDCIYELGYKDSEDYDNVDKARNKAMMLLNNLECYIDNVRMP